MKVKVKEIKPEDLLQWHLERTYPDKGVKRIKLDNEWVTRVYNRLMREQNQGKEWPEEFSKRLEGIKLDFSSYTDLEVLFLKELGNYVSDITLGNKPNLESIVISDSDISYLDLSQCPNLERLAIADQGKVIYNHGGLKSVEFLNDLPNPDKLKFIDIWNSKVEATDIAMFAKFTNLEYLQIGNFSFLNVPLHIVPNHFFGSMQSLENLTKLTVLKVENTDVIQDEEYKNKLLERNKNNLREASIITEANKDAY